jgi:anti-anti-sigma regulatory factor
MELSGSLDISSAAHLREQLLAALEIRDYEVRAAQVTRADAAALQLLCAFARESSGKFRLREPSRSLRDAAELLGLAGELGL